MDSYSTIRKIQEGLLHKDYSCEELTKSYLDAIERDNQILNSYVTVTPEEAFSAAKRVDQKIAAGKPLSPLEGVPMTLKDNISTNKISTTCCSKILSGYTPIYDAAVWETLKAQNAILLGKTNMDEFAMGSTCETSCYGGAKNPHNLKRVPGGSSGGGASAVCANLAAYALGSDTGGSIRQPASFCGVVGLKPTYGAVSRYGLIAFASSFDQIGPIAGCAEDAALVFDAISSYDERDSTCSGRKGAPCAESLNQSIKGMKIGIPKEYYEGLRPGVQKALENAQKTYQELGCELVPLALPELQYALPVYYILACAEASSNLGRYDGIRYGYKTEHYNDLNEMICKTRSEGFGAEVQRRILLGTYVLSSGYYDAYYKKAQILRGKIVDAFRSAFQKCDMILAPTVPVTALPQHYSSNAVDNYRTDICTVPVNIAGLPGISVPCGKDEDNMPVGMQLIGRKFEEATILRAAHQYEKAVRDTVFCPVKMGVEK